MAVKLKRLDILIAQAAQELERYETFRMKLYEAMTDGLVDREEYHQMRKRYTQQIEVSEQALHELEQRRKETEEEAAPDRTWMEQFLQYQNITAKEAMDIAYDYGYYIFWHLGISSLWTMPCMKLLEKATGRLQPKDYKAVS